MIQPIGFHVRLSDEWLVTAVSANLGDFLAVAASDALGHPITALFSEEAIHDIRNRMALLRGDGGIEHLFHYPLSGQEKPFDLAIYPHGNGFSIDAEPCDEHGFGDATGIVLGMLARIEAALDVGPLCDQAANQVRALTGFERVVIFANGKVIGESARTGTDFADFAAIAVTDTDVAIVDCDAVPVDILAIDRNVAVGPRSTLRYPTVTEREALTAANARAALIVPLICDGKAWGQVGCFHRAARHVSAERRNIARLFARIVSLRIEIAELHRRD